MRAIIFESFMELGKKFTGPFMRRVGKQLYERGTAI